VALGIAVAGGLMLMVATDNDEKVPDAAVAALAAAVIGVAGTHLGHATGHQHGSESEGSPDKPAWTHRAIIVGLIAVALGAGALAFVYMPKALDVSDEAAAALVAALVGIVCTDLANARWFRSSTPRWAGLGLILVSVVGGVALVLSHPGNLSAEGLATFAAAGVGIGATLHGHRRGQELARQRPDRLPSNAGPNSGPV
jgi:hypothetical protein